MKVFLTVKNGMPAWLVNWRSAGQRRRRLPEVARLGLPAAEWPEEMAAQLRSGWVIYDPAAMFPGRLEAAFAFFCAWVFALAEELPGRKLLACDELQNLIGHFNLPWEFACVLETGRRRGLDGVYVSQQPNLLHNRVRGQSTELLLGPRAGRPMPASAR